MLSYQDALREPCLTAEVERQAIRAWQAKGDKDALGRLTASHARLAWSEARRWSNSTSDTEDLAAEGMIGLIEAANEFDLDRGVRFSTYASWFVKNRVVAASAKLGAVLDMPARVYLDARAGRLDPIRNADALAALDGVAADTSAADDETGIVVPCPDRTPEETAVARSSETRVKALLAQALENLDPMERTMIDRHLGMNDAGPVPAMDRSRARAIERRAMHRLRNSLQEQGFSLALLSH